MDVHCYISLILVILLVKSPISNENKNVSFEMVQSTD